MLRSVDDVKPEQVVFLTPHTKMAGRWCWMKKEAVVIDAKTHWPRVKVSVTHDGGRVDAYVHKDDIKLKAETKTRQADMGDGGLIEAGTHRKLALPNNPKYQIAEEDGEQLPLF